MLAEAEAHLALRESRSNNECPFAGDGRCDEVPSRENPSRAAGLRASTWSCGPEWAQPPRMECILDFYNGYADTAHRPPTAFCAWGSDVIDCGQNFSSGGGDALRLALLDAAEDAYFTLEESVGEELGPAFRSWARTARPVYMFPVNVYRFFVATVVRPAVYFCTYP